MRYYEQSLRIQHIANLSQLNKRLSSPRPISYWDIWMTLCPVDELNGTIAQVLGNEVARNEKPHRTI